MSQRKDRKKVGVTPEVIGSSPRQDVERLIDKGRFKDAVKQAKLCFRGDATPENHRLLERAYFLRARELHRESMPASAVEVAHHLLEFGITDPGLLAEVIPLLLAIGMSGPALSLRDRLESPDAKARFIIKAADEAVLHPEQAANAWPEVREGALLIRDVIAALDGGHEREALERLRDVPRNSPFADWRYFLRGLAAFHRGDGEQVAANWDRLDPTRAAFKIARGVRTTKAESGESAAVPANSADLGALETQVFGEPILSRLEQLRTLVVENRWPEAIRILGPLRLSLRKLDPRLAVRLTRILISPLMREAVEGSYRDALKLVGAFAKAAEPLPIDPRWNRLWALLWEGPQGELPEAERFWLAYLRDLQTIPTLSADERRRAQATVWEHLGLEYASEASEDSSDSFEETLSPSEIRFAKKRAIQCLEESLKIDPNYLSAYTEFREIYEEWDDLDNARLIANRHLAVAPNDFDTLLWLNAFHMTRNEPELGLPPLLRARALKPLDEELRHREWFLRVALARHLALKLHWDEGRAEFTMAESLWPEQCLKFGFLAKRAVFELKAADPERAQTFIMRAEGSAAESTPVWLAILIEGSRYGLSKVQLARFEKLWETGLSNKGKSETAGAMADLLSAALTETIDYDGRAAHVEKLVGYLKRTSRIRYLREDLINVCRFLEFDPNSRTLVQTFVKRGLKNFPDSARFRLLSATMELEKGPSFRRVASVKKEIEKALQLAQSSSLPEEARVAPDLKLILSKLEAVVPDPFHFPFGGFGRGFPEDMFAEDEDFEDEDFPSAAPRPGKTDGTKPSKKKKKG